MIEGATIVHHHPASAHQAAPNVALPPTTAAQGLGAANPTHNAAPAAPNHQNILGHSIATPAHGAGNPTIAPFQQAGSHQQQPVSPHASPAMMQAYPPPARFQHDAPYRPGAPYYQAVAPFMSAPSAPARYMHRPMYAPHRREAHFHPGLPLSAAYSVPSMSHPMHLPHGSAAPYYVTPKHVGWAPGFPAPSPYPASVTMTQRWAPTFPAPHSEYIPRNILSRTTSGASQGYYSRGQPSPQTHGYQPPPQVEGHAGHQPLPQAQGLVGNRLPQHIEGHNGNQPPGEGVSPHHEAEQGRGDPQSRDRGRGGHRSHGGDDLTDDSHANRRHGSTHESTHPRCGGPLQQVHHHPTAFFMWNDYRQSFHGV